jgi:NAD+-dependent secondary alcohol dehydrogenase Adh1
MKAIRVHAYGQPPQVDDVPEPEASGPDDVVVRIGGAGLCRTDLHIIDGWFADTIPADLPLVPGHENAGWVHAVGPAVEHLAVGDPVICHPNLTCGVCGPCRAGDDMRCARGPNIPGLMCAGGMAELFKTSARAIVKLGTDANPAELAALADAGLTAYHAVAKAARKLRPGDKAVVIGAGGLGHIGVQVLRALSSVEMIVLDRNADALALAKDLGADHTVVADDNAVAAVQDLTDGKGAEAVIDFVGEGGAVEVGVACLRRNGNYYVIGYGGAINVPTIDIISTEINFIGNLVGSYNDLAELMVLAARGQVTLHTATYSLSDYQKALDDLDNGKVRGRAILVP